MAECVDNPATGRFACGDTYSGELQHCVAKVPWADWPDGLAHVTASLSVIEACWRKGTNGQMANPADLGFVQDEGGRWRSPMSEEDRERLRQAREG